MATIKSYTDIEQSKKLAEILPLESADMCYVIDYTESNKYGTDHFNLEIDTYGLKVKTRDNVPCWSLAALLNVLPQSVRLVGTPKGSYWYCECVDSNNQWYAGFRSADNPVDTCYEMIVKLHELNLL